MQPRRLILHRKLWLRDATAGPIPAASALTPGQRYLCSSFFQSPPGSPAPAPGSLEGGSAKQAGQWAVCSQEVPGAGTEQSCTCAGDGCSYIPGAESCGFVTSPPSHSPSQALMMDDEGPCRVGSAGRRAAERRKALPRCTPRTLLTSAPSPGSSPGPGEGQCPTLCPTWSVAGLVSPLAPCRSPASSESLSDLTSTTFLSLRASGFVLGEGGDNFETCLRYQRGHMAG